MSMASDDITVELLRSIRDEIRGVNQRIDVTNQRLDVAIARMDLTNQRLDGTNDRLDVVESTLLDVVAEQRLLLRHTRAISERALELEALVTKVETK
jgi:hypothetical protein